MKGFFINFKDFKGNYENMFMSPKLLLFKNDYYQMSKVSWELYYYTLKLSEKVLFSREYCINTGNIQID